MRNIAPGNVFMITDASVVSGRVFEASLLRLFNTAKLENAARITLWRNRPPARTVSQETLEGRLSRGRHRRLVHFLNRSKFLYWLIGSHLLN